MTLEQILAESPLWQLGRIKQYTLLHGGLSNQNYLLETAGDRFVLRINNPTPERFGIDRKVELDVLKTLQGQAFAPEIAYSCPQQNYLISHFITGKSFAQQAPSAAEADELAAIINQYQQLPFSGKTINYRQQLHNYYQQLHNYYQQRSAAQQLTAKLKNDWQNFQATLTQFEQSQWRPVLCHHDLVPENIIRSDQGLKIIDWEYAANGHPLFDQSHSGINNTKQERLDNTELQHIIHWLDQLWRLVNSL